MSELALDDDQRHAFMLELDGVGMAELVRREAAADAGRVGVDGSRMAEDATSRRCA
jgi:hypothetical protein